MNDLVANKMQVADGIINSLAIYKSRNHIAGISKSLTIFFFKYFFRNNKFPANSNPMKVPQAPPLMTAQTASTTKLLEVACSAMAIARTTGAPISRASYEAIRPEPPMVPSRFRLALALWQLVQVWA